MKGRTVGIDLGTTYSCIAYVDDDGFPKVSPDCDDHVNTPSFIILEDEGDIIVGSVAKESCVLYNSNNIVNAIKRQIGSDYTLSVQGRTYNPSQLSALILDKILNDFQERNGFRPESAVITCPAYFGNEERRATKQAGEIAGLKEVTILNEPTAAAICFGFGQDDDCHKRILVYDLGGGTFDITILQIDGREFTALATDGDRCLGGNDWDAALIELILQKISDASGVSVERLRKVDELMRQLVIDSESAKIKLTTKDEVNMTIIHRARKYRYTITRQEFDNCTSALLHTTLDLIDRALNSKGMSPEDIDEIVLVGGSTLMPQIVLSIKNRYPENRVCIYDPHESIAKGAALYGVALDDVPVAPVQEPVENADEPMEETVSQEQAMPVMVDDTPRETSVPDAPQEDRLVIHNVLSKTFGVLAKRNGSTYISNIIYRNEVLPIQATRQYCLEDDYQKELVIEIYEDFAMNEQTESVIPQIDGVPVGSFTMQLPIEADRDTVVDVTFTADNEGILTAIAECLGQRKEYTIDSDIIMSPEEIESSRKDITG